MATLTDTKARQIKPDDTPFPHGGITGLTLHPSTSKGHGKWVLRFISPVTKKRRNAGLGIYPEISIADVVKQAHAMRQQIAQGIDPLEQKRVNSEKIAVSTFENAARRIHTDLLPGWKNDKHGKQWIATLEQYVFPLIGTATINTISPAHIAEVLSPIWLSIPETASRVKQRLHAVNEAWQALFYQR